MRVEVSGLERRFGQVKALDDVCFTLPPGRRVALVGPNGSGKSTLNRVLVGLLRYEGSVLLDGVAPRDCELSQVRRMAYLPQVSPQLGAPIRELVRAVTTLRGISTDAVEVRAAALGLDLSALAARPLRGLSGGMRQKLMLALALAAPSSLLVLDEPTASLDPVTRQRFFELFDELAGDATVVLCSHRLEEVRALVDHVIVLDEGRVVLDGGAEELLAACEFHTIDARVAGVAAEAWLEREGFRARSQGWWSRTDGSGEKSVFVRRMVHELGNALIDLEVRPSESLDFSKARAASEGGELAPVVDLESKRHA